MLSEVPLTDQGSGSASDTWDSTTGKAVSGINGAAVDSAFNLPSCKQGKQFCYRLSNEKFFKNCHLCKYLTTVRWSVNVRQ